MADEVKQLSGEARIDALCEVLTVKHGFAFPAEVYMPDGSGTEKYEGGAWTDAGDGTDYPKSEEQPEEHGE